MTHTNFDIADCFNLFFKQMKNISAYPLLLILTIIYIIILIVNFKNKKMHISMYILHGLLILIICIFFGSKIINNIDTFFKSDFIKNTYFYLFNMIISIMLSTKVIVSKKINDTIKYICLVPYSLIIFFLLLFIYMSNIVNYNMLYIFGNTYPSVYFGNIISIFLYIIIFVSWLFIIIKRYKKSDN